MDTTQLDPESRLQMRLIDAETAIEGFKKKISEINASIQGLNIGQGSIINRVAALESVSRELRSKIAELTTPKPTENLPQKSLWNFFKYK